MPMPGGCQRHRQGQRIGIRRVAPGVRIFERKPAAVLADGSYFPFVQQRDQFAHWRGLSLAASTIVSISGIVAGAGFLLIGCDAQFDPQDHQGPQDQPDACAWFALFDLVDPETADANPAGQFGLVEVKSEPTVPDQGAKVGGGPDYGAWHGCDRLLCIKYGIAYF